MMLEITQKIPIAYVTFTKKYVSKFNFIISYERLLKTIYLCSRNNSKRPGKNLVQASPPKGRTHSIPEAQENGVIHHHGMHWRDNMKQLRLSALIFRKVDKVWGVGGASGLLRLRRLISASATTLLAIGFLVLYAINYNEGIARLIDGCPP